MGKRILAGLLAVALALTLGGCWNYRSLDQMNIVVGVAVDYNEENKLFELSYETADLTGAQKRASITGKIITSQGKTIFDAVRNTKRKEEDRLFFGNSNLLVISHQVVQKMGIMPVIEWFLRDGECRETMNVAISQEGSARALLETTQDTSGIISRSLYDIIREDKDVTATSVDVKLFQVYGKIRSKRNSVALPVLHKVKNGEKEIPELNGTGILKGDKLIGYLSPEQSKYLLFVEGKLKSGILTLSLSDLETDDISLEILRNKSKKSFSYDEGKITVNIKTETCVAIGENRTWLDMMDPEVIQRIEDAAREKIETNIRELTSTLQNEFRTDVLGFGETIYQRDLKLWKQLEPSWEEIYPTVEVEVSSRVRVVNSAFIK